MSLSFDGINDSVTIATVTLSNTMTIAGWFNVAAASGAVWTHGTYGTFGGHGGMHWQTATKLRLQYDRSPTGGVWDMTTGFSAATGPKWFGVSYDWGSTANHPTLVVYESSLSVLTNGSGLTQVFVPSGSFSGDGGTFYIGNRAAGDMPFNGKQQEFAAWNRALSAAELTMVFTHGVQAMAGAYLYFPMDLGNASDYSGNGRTGTVNGAVLAENFAATRPAGRMG